MREFTVPATVTVPDDARVTDMVIENAREAPELVSFSRRSATGWEDVTAAAFAAEVTAVARGLIGAGVGAGDRVAIMSANRYEWTLLDYAIWTAGAVVVPIYETSSAEQVQWIVSDSGAVAVVVETAAHLAVLDGVRADLPDLRHVWTIEAGAVEAIVGLGTDVTEEEVERRRTAVGPDDLATIDLHQRHHRPAQGLRADPPQLAVRGDVDRGRAAQDVPRRRARRCSSCRWRTSSAGWSRSAA